jgi:hypothetical protein
MDKKSCIDQLIEQIERRYGFNDIEIVPTSKETLLLKRKTDSNKEYTSVSIVIADAEPVTYSVQVEVPDPEVPLLGINIPFVSDNIISIEEVLNVIGKYLLSG